MRCDNEDSDCCLLESPVLLFGSRRKKVRMNRAWMSFGRRCLSEAREGFTNPGASEDLRTCTFGLGPGCSSVPHKTIRVAAVWGRILASRRRVFQLDFLPCGGIGAGFCPPICWIVVRSGPPWKPPDYMLLRSLKILKPERSKGRKHTDPQTYGPWRSYPNVAQTQAFLP